MCETLFLRNVYTKEVIAFLKHVDLKSPLQNVRLRISSEITSLSDNVFDFIVAGTTIKPKQEQKYEVGVCATRSADGKLYLDIKRRSSTATTMPIVETVDTLTDQQGTNSFRHTINSRPYNRPDKNSDGGKQSDEKNYGKTSKTTATQHNYPNFYSDKDIEETGELEKDRKIFFNSKLREIIEEGSLHDWGVQAIQGVIDVHWVLRKNNILKNCVKELIAGSTHSEKDATPGVDKRRTDGGRRTTDDGRRTTDGGPRSIL